MIPSGDHHVSRGGGDDHGAVARLEIQPVVEAALAVEGIVALTEQARDSRGGERPLEGDLARCLRPPSAGEGTLVFL